MTEKTGVAAIEGVLIKPAREVVHGFMFSPELWAWVYQVFPKFAGKRVEITVREVEEEKAGHEDQDKRQ